MSSEQKPAALNLYGILDNELARMHTLMQTYLTLPQQQYSQTYGASATNASHQMPVIYKRITEIQDMLLKAVVAHDTLIQDKVAELAFMGVEDETIPSR